MSIAFIVGISGIILLLIGGLISYYIPGKRDPSKESTLTDHLGPMLIKNFTIRPQKIYNDFVGDELEKKRTLMRNIGIVLFVLGCLLSIAYLILDPPFK